MSGYRSRLSLTLTKQVKFSWLFSGNSFFLVAKDGNVAIPNNYKSALPVYKLNGDVVVEMHFTITSF